MTITLGYSQASAPSAARIAEASGGRIVAVRGDAQINWGRRYSTGLNPNITKATNKRVARELFRDAGVPAPVLMDAEWMIRHMQQLSPTDDASGIMCVGRPDFHTRGRGFWRVDDLDTLNRALRGTRRKAAATHFMEFIDAPKEFRIHVFKGKSIRISQKAFTDDRKDYTTVKPDPELPKKHLRHAAIAAVEALDLDFGTVDMLASDDQQSVWVLEVNCAPGLGGSMPRVWAETFISYMEGEWDA
jgi:glutathione synthase/RimK-type ligase-like ATP-grasp enzyme